MKSLSPNPILLLITRSAGAHRRFHPNPPSFTASRRQQHEEESRSVRVSVWWDFENCHLPQGSNVFRVAHSITTAVRASGIKGPVQITAFGDVAQLSRNNQEAMSSTGITLTHIPNGGKNSADRSLLIDLMCWVSHNPPPAHLFLISGDRDFATVLHRLRMNNYNILLAGPESAPGVLCSAASIVWQWNELAKGENVNGKYFNQPPDGPYGSWYGHYKGPLENPFAVIGQPPCPRLEKIPDSNQDPKPRLGPKISNSNQDPKPQLGSKISNSDQDPNPRVVPKPVMRQIRHILCSRPKGISITELRIELMRCNVDKDLYGFKKFSQFLLSMPHILKLQSGPNGQLFVYSAYLRWPEFADPAEGVNTGPAAINEEPQSVTTPTGNTECVNAKPSLPRSVEQNVKPYENIEKPLSTSTIEVSVNPDEKIEKHLSTSPIEVNIKPNEKIEKPSLPSDIKKTVKLKKKIEKVDKGETREQPLQSVDSSNPTPEVGFFGRTWRQWLYGMGGDTGIGNSNAETSAKNVKVDQSNLSSTSLDGVEQSSKNGRSSKEKFSGVSAAVRDKDTGNVSTFKRVAARCMFWRETPTIENVSPQSGEKLELATVGSGKHELFSQESFWKGLKEFLDTPTNDLVLVLHSMSREQMAHNLQKHGPLSLRSLGHNDLLQLVNLLITDKRWVEECSSQTYPFKLVLPPKHSSSPNTPNKSALSSAFLGLSSPSNPPRTEKILENDGERRNQNSPHINVSPSVTNNKTRGFNKSRNDILSDCQKLVDNIVKEHPAGFNIGCFRKHFLDAYGYPLDIQKLGYQKLVTLLQIMPGVKVESSHIYPSCNVSSDVEVGPSVKEIIQSRVTSKLDSKLSDPPIKDDELDATWEELGPVAVTESKKNKEFGSLKSAKETKVKRVNRDYEALADDYISDSEEDTSSPATGSELPGLHKTNQEDSSLLSILDSWYSTKEEKDIEEESKSEDVMADYSENESKGSYDDGNCGLVLKTEKPFARCGLKPRATRRYSFVSEQNGNNNEKLIDGILGSMKKSGESRIHG